MMGWAAMLAYGRRVWAWLLANPVVGAIAAVIAYVGVTRLRMRHLENRAARAQASADAARRELAEREFARKAVARRAEINARRQEAEDATTQEREGRQQAGDAHGTLEEIAKRWPPQR